MAEFKRNTGHLSPFPLVAILGPTAVGKTAISLRLASEIRGEIVNFDSIQVYKGLDIGSAKPSIEERLRIPHHLIDIVDPDEPFDAALFAAKAQMAIKSITFRGRVAILTGGTNLYLKALLEGLVPCPGEAPALRTMLRGVVRNAGARILHEFLSQIDPETAERLHPNDSFRVIRAIEVYSLTGHPISFWHKKHQNDTIARSQCIKIGLIRPIDELYERIDRRVDAMIEAGLIDEVRRLLMMGYSPRLKPLQSLGYRHIIQFLSGEVDLHEALRQLKRDHRHYARRQLIWLRREHGIRWLHPDKLNGVKNIWPIISGAASN
ncbi:MAG: tRNA (adenosine(37)-N6)-dimethylallyltransferase MiaA [Dissulfurimicrobium sp.]|uniref:tRNA (adenosine(37)-N6)-dimethylallyltransferase MiaA n=1 Tax=Dissulfurimicrobium sp. TaxID=2022436 RepID=UPI00404AB6D1